MRKNIKYTTSGKLSYILTSKGCRTWNNKILYNSNKDILDDILLNSFEDGMYGYVLDQNEFILLKSNINRL